MRSMERGPSLPPAAKARAERNAARRAARAKPSGPARWTRRFFVVSLLVAVSMGFIGFSLQWPEMPYALYVGLAVTAVVFVLALSLRLLQRRAGAGR